MLFRHKNYHLPPLLWPVDTCSKKKNSHKLLSLFKKAMGTMVLSTWKILVYLLWSYETSTLGPLFYRNWPEISIWWIHAQAAGFLSRRVSWSSSLINAVSETRTSTSVLSLPDWTHWSHEKVEESWNYKLSKAQAPNKFASHFLGSPGAIVDPFVSRIKNIATSNKTYCFLTPLSVQRTRHFIKRKVNSFYYILGVKRITYVSAQYFQ